MKLVTSLLISLLFSTLSEAATYYVATTGSDSNPGTQAAPFRTIQKAANIVNPGDTVLVSDGVFSAKVSVSRGGTSSGWVTFKSQNKWGAKIQAAVHSGFQITAPYIRVEGFDISGQYSSIGAAAFDVGSGGSNIQIVGNNMHDIARICTDTTYGMDGIYLESVSNITIEGNVFHDIGRLGPGEDGCNPATGYYKNHDHGIYINGSNNVTVKNNLFYNNKSGWAIHPYPNTMSGLKVLNNTFVFPNPYNDGHIMIAAPISNSLIANNIFYQPKRVAITYCCGESLSNVQANNNIIYGGTISSLHSGITFSGNLDNTDPKLVNPTGLNFQLQSTSPAINSGLALPEVTTDFDGAARPPYDMGAFRYTGSALSAPTNLAVSP